MFTKHLMSTNTYSQDEKSKTLLTELRLKIIKNKCAYIIFKKRRNITLNSKVYLLCSEVKRVSEFKYLGIFL